VARRNGHAIICAVLLTIGCGKAPDEPEPAPAESAEKQLFDKTADRLLGLSDAGFVVSRWHDGRMAHEGDSVLWTAMAMGTLDCARGSLPEAALLQMLSDNAGRICRHPSLCAVKPPSLDSHLGFYWGIANRIKLCPESKPVWAEALVSHVPQDFPGAFDAVRQSVYGALNLGSAPDSGRVGRLVGLVAGWAAAVNAAQAAGYRAHLGLLSLETLEASGVSIPAAKRDLFCAATGGMGLGTIDHYCGRGDLLAFVGSFEFDAFEYRFQRARWESPDGKLGLATPALDLLVALRVLYAF